LICPAQDDFSPAVIAPYFAFDLDLSTFQSPHISDLLQVSGKNHHRKWTDPEILAEIEKVDAAVSKLDVQNFATYAAGRSDVPLGIMKGHALGCANGRG
jgi:hypothetical protein